MPVNALNFVITRTVLDRAIESSGREPTEEQKKDITKASFVSALTPGNLGMFVPFIVRDSIVGDEEGTETGDGDEPGDAGEVKQRLEELEDAVGANKTQLEGIKTELQSLGAKLDRLLAANPEATPPGSTSGKSSSSGPNR
jgi:hypothetical protein